MSPVAETCVPPHSSMLKPGTLTTRTLSPYFSPKSAIAPAAIASSGDTSTSVFTGVLRHICSLTMRSMRSSSSRVIAWKCTKSKRSRSGATSEPACLTCVPSTWRSAAWSRCVAVWLRRVASRTSASTSAVTMSRVRSSPRATRTRWARGKSLRTGMRRSPSHHGVARRAVDAAGVGHLAAGLEVERRLRQDDPACLALAQHVDQRPPLVVVENATIGTPAVRVVA